LKELEANLFPPILMLMNINGTLIHRTSERIEFVQLKNKDGEIDHGAERNVKMFKHKKNFVYFRDSYMAFLKQIM
jgi:hypothetical protein